MPGMVLDAAAACPGPAATANSAQPQHQQPCKQEAGAEQRHLSHWGVPVHQLAGDLGVAVKLGAPVGPGPVAVREHAGAVRLSIQPMGSQQGGDVVLVAHAGLARHIHPNVEQCLRAAAAVGPYAACSCCVVVPCHAMSVIE